MNRFVEGKYAVGHAFGVMCGFHPGPLADEAVALADYIRQSDRAAKLQCVANDTGEVITVPSAAAPPLVRFDTLHNRPTQTPADPITLLHMLIPCVDSPTLRPPIKRAAKSAGTVRACKASR